MRRRQLELGLLNLQCQPVSIQSRQHVPGLHPISQFNRHLSNPPYHLESQADADRVVAPLLDLAGSLEPQASGFVIACFGDPGLHALRDETALPVVGIQEAAVTTALRLGHRFGVISILPASVPRHLRAFGAMGVLDRLAGDRAIGLGVADLADEARSLDAMIATGTRLRDEDGADVLIMGCAGMAERRAALEAATGLPVVITDKCTSCGMCVEACPRNIIEMRPKHKRDLKIFVGCLNEEKGGIARKACSVACIGCCALAPCVMIDDKVESRMTPQKVAKLFRKGGQI